MTVKITNALYRYFKGLYELNQDIIILCGIDTLDKECQFEDYLENVIHLVPKLIPYKYDKKEKKEKIYKLENRDGLLEFENEIPFLKTDYKNTLEDHMMFLTNIKAISNKLEHKMHGATYMELSGGNVWLFEIIYNINKDKIKITASELIAFVKDLYILFSKIQMHIKNFSYDENKNDCPYYRRLTKFFFQDFNKIYDCDFIATFGKVMLPF